MSRYRKLDPRFWKDEKIRHLSQIEKLISLYAFTGQSNRIGLFSFSPGEAVEDLGLSKQTFAKGFGKVCKMLSLGWDSEARVLYLPTWWKYNHPENPNVLKSILTDLHELPQTPLITEFSSNLRYLSETFHQTFREGLGKPSPKRMPHQEQEQEQEEDGRKPSPPYGKGPHGGKTAPSFNEPDLYAVEFDQVKAIYPRRDGDQRWQKALSHYRVARKVGESLEVILAGVQRYHGWCERKGLINTDKVKQAATFMGPEKCWREPWEVPKVAAGGFVG